MNQDLKALIKKYEQEGYLIEPDATERKKLQNQVVKYTEAFLNENQDGKGYVEFESHHLNSLTDSFNEKGETISEIIEKASGSLDYTGINPASGNHLGYIPGGGIYSSALADYWIDVTNRYAGVFYANPGAVKIENEVIRWSCQIVGYPKSAWGCLLSGGSNANMTAIIAAREEKLKSLEAYPKAVIYMTDQTHHCVLKALKIAGLHHSVIRRIPVDQQFKMKVDDLEEQIKFDLKEGLNPFMIIGTVGTTDTGAIDPVNDLAKIAREYGAWFHVDAAYGGYFILTDLLDSFKEGIQACDSIVMDPHKSLFLPYGLGIALVRNRNHLKSAFTQTGNYMQNVMETDEELSPADVSPELTKHFRGFRMWLPLKLHGIAPFRANLFEKYFLAQYFHKKVSLLEGFEVGPKPELSVVLYRLQIHGINPNDVNQKLVGKIHKDGTIFVSTTSINGEYWIRAAILVFRTHLNTIDLFLTLLERFAEETKQELAGATYGG